MTKSTEIKQRIAEIESTVNANMSKENLYDKLIVAYNLYKDLVVLLEDPSLAPDTSLETIEELRKDVSALKASNEVLASIVSNVQAALPST